MMPDPTPADTGFLHLALLYRSSQEYLATLVTFVQAGLAQAEPVLVAVPGAAGDLLRDQLGPAEGQLAFADMETLGRNPARIIPAVSSFVDAHPAGPSGISGSPPGQLARPMSYARPPGMRR